MSYIVGVYIALCLSIIIINKIRVKKTINSPKAKQMFREIQVFLLSIDDNRQTYFTNSQKEKLKETYKNLHYKLSKGEFKNIITDETKKFVSIYSKLDNLVKDWNKEYVENELAINEILLSNIDGKSLDEQQRKAVVVDEDNNLILAGAGSGKTLTIAAKVKYLVETKNINPDDILLISFTKKAADEMNERIRVKLGIDVKANTFHKLGLDIIGRDIGRRPDVAEDLLEKVIEDYFKGNIYYDSKILEDLIIFLGYYINIPKGIESFENIGEYYKYCKSLDLTTLKGKNNIEQINKLEIEELKQGKKTIKGEKVKSLEEVIIANFLYLNGVEYKYEDKYPYETGDKYRKIYRPDFYLPKYNIYIEHFGINRNNKCPQLSKIEEIKYLDGMQWKKKLHREYNTTLIETYSYYQSEGILLQKLRSKLVNNGVNLKNIDNKEVYKTIYENKEDKYFKELRKLIKTFITLFKSSGYDLQDFNNLHKCVLKIKNKFIRERSQILLNIIKPIYAQYEATLWENGKVDFDDMINQSTNSIINKRVKLNYKYIIIDEYQDISKSRFNLIKAIKDLSNAKLVCVGDDWQSIFRFAGSDIDLFTNFREHIGHYELLKIEKTYRNSQNLIEIASKFVLKNEKQIEKNLKSHKKNQNPIKIINYSEDKLLGFKKSIENIVKEFGIYSEVTLLGRNSYDINFLAKEATNGEFEIKKKNGEQIVESKEYPTMKMRFLTVHKSKGLESDNVIILNLENKTSGFPNQIEDDPILDLVLTQPENYVFAEERRLFYVALTRTRNNCYLLVPKMNSSIFCDELVKDFQLVIEDIDNTGKENIVKCPKCVVGNLVHRKSDDKGYSFVSCSNYPVCDFKSNSIDILDKPVICKSCGGFMVKRGYSGNLFLGCTNYPHCRNKQKYIEPQVCDANNKYSKEVKEKDYEIIKKEEKISSDYLQTQLNEIIEENIYFTKNAKITKEKTSVDLYIRDRDDERDIFYETCTIDKPYEVGEKFNYNNKHFIVAEKTDNSLYLKHEVVSKNVIQNESRYRVDLYMKNAKNKGFDYYTTCTLDSKYFVGEILIYDNKEFVVVDVWDKNIFIKTKDGQLKEENINISVKENIELHVEYDKSYTSYITCIADVKLKIDDIIKDYNKYFIVNKLSDNKIYLKKVGSNIISNRVEETKKILTLYLDNKYYKKYLTDIKYNIGDTFINQNCKFKIIDIFKDTIFIKSNEEQNIELTQDTIINTDELLKKEMEIFRIEKIKTQLALLKKSYQIMWDEKLWIDGLIKYIEGNFSEDTFSDLDILNIIYCDNLLNGKWILEQIDYLKECDIEGYRKKLSLLEWQIDYEDERILGEMEECDYYEETNFNEEKDIKQYIFNKLKCDGKKCIGCGSGKYICEDCQLFFNQ